MYSALARQRGVSGAGCEWLRDRGPDPAGAHLARAVALRSANASRTRHHPFGSESRGPGRADADANPRTDTPAGATNELAETGVSNPDAGECHPNRGQTWSAYRDSRQCCRHPTCGPTDAANRDSSRGRRLWYPRSDARDARPSVGYRGYGTQRNSGTYRDGAAAHSASGYTHSDPAC